MDARRQQLLAAQVAQDAAQAQTTVDQRLSARFQSILAEAGVSVTTQNLLAVASVTTPALFGNSAESPAELDSFLSDMIGLDPSTETDPAARAFSRGE